jgi:hypothetical protein
MFLEDPKEKKVAEILKEILTQNNGIGKGEKRKLTDLLQNIPTFVYSLIIVIKGNYY